jgi:hypothetical protein
LVHRISYDASDLIIFQPVGTGRRLVENLFELHEPTALKIDQTPFMSFDFW